MTDPHDSDTPSITPVPGRARHDGLTPERQRRFSQVIAAAGTVAVGKTAWSAYKLRERPGADGFAQAWDIAQQIAGDRAFQQAIDRAIHGVEVPRCYQGRLVGTERRLHLRLAAKVLDRHFAQPTLPIVDFATAMAHLTDEHGN